MTNNFAFEVKVDLCLKYTFTGGGWLDKSIIMLISAPVGFELGLGAELGKKNGRGWWNLQHSCQVAFVLRLKNIKQVGLVKGREGHKVMYNVIDCKFLPFIEEKKFESFFKA